MVERIDRENVVVIELDNYYKDRTGVSQEELKHINFDHPSAFDINRLISDIRNLIDNKTTPTPVYSFKTSTIIREEVKCPKPIIIIEGLVLFSIEKIFDMLDLKIFLDLDADLRLIRRLRRDVLERSKNIEENIESYIHQVKPMHEENIEPFKKKPTLI